MKSKRDVREIHDLIINQRGSFTLEASLVFPMIFLIVVSLIFFSVYMFRTVLLYQKASVMAERATFAWNNSYRDPATGAISTAKFQTDGLYWRIIDDGLSGVIGNKTMVTVNQGKPTSDTSLPTKKLSGAVNSTYFEDDGEITYSNKIYKREVEVKLNRVLPTIGFARGLGVKDKAEANVKSLVAEPVEFIRNVDFAIYVGDEIQNTTYFQDFKTKFSLQKKKTGQ